MQILIRPIVTEKMNKQAETMNTYGFKVNPEANKIQIREAVEEFYNVSVYSIRTMNYAGKKSSRYTKNGIVSGKTSAYKKAIVTLVDGDTIDFYDHI